MPYRDTRTAFTLVELLVSIAICLILAGGSFAAFGMAKKQANLTADIAASKRLIQAYLAKAADDDGVLPRGRYSENNPPEIFTEDGTPLSTLAPKIVLQRYPLHLAPYLGWKVEETFLNWANRSDFKKGMELYKGQAQASKANYYYMLSVQPAFGHNVYGIGGYASSTTTEAVTRLNQVSSPSSLLVFVSSKDNQANGFSFVEPPSSAKEQRFFDGSTRSTPYRWSDGEYHAGSASAFGQIAFIHNGKAVATFLDGHVEVLSIEELRDSRRWSVAAYEADDPEYVIAR